MKKTICIFITLLFNQIINAQLSAGEAKKWSLSNTHTTEAWKISSGSKKIIVAIIDTGVDANHPDLQANLWQNPGETGNDNLGRDRAKNGIDDDHNGYIDDVNGWNFVDNNNDLTDTNGHGTHITGIIGGRSLRNPALSGVSPRVSLMILKYFSQKANNQDNLENTIGAIRYAQKMGARIINYSSGGNISSQEEEAAILDVQNQGILFVAAAGNNGLSADNKAYFPASYNLDNIISVTAIDSKLKVLQSSNYGKLSVDIAAPGKDILSTLQNNNYGYMTGTSQATAQVTGALALLLADNPGLTDLDAIKSHLLITSRYEKNLVAKTKYSSRLDTLRALAIKGHGLNLLGFKSKNKYLWLDGIK